jgi:hypothetical protein
MLPSVVHRRAHPARSLLGYAIGEEAAAGRAGRALSECLRLSGESYLRLVAKPGEPALRGSPLRASVPPFQRCVLKRPVVAIDGAPR